MHVSVGSRGDQDTLGSQDGADRLDRTTVGELLVDEDDDTRRRGSRFLSARRPLRRWGSRWLPPLHDSHARACEPPPTRTASRPDAHRHRPAYDPPTGAATEHRSQVGPPPFGMQQGGWGTRQDVPGALARHFAWCLRESSCDLGSIFRPDSRESGVKPGTVESATASVQRETTPLQTQVLNQLRPRRGWHASNAPCALTGGRWSCLRTTSPPC